MKKITISPFFLLAVFVSLPSIIHAATFDVPAIKVDGFATVAGVATNTDSDDVAYLDADKNMAFETDSKVGLQFKLPVTERLSYTMQIVSKAVDSWNLETEWAYGAFKVNDMLEVRAGRMRIPFFRISDTMLIGYSYPWVRPPLDTYAQFAFSRFTGVDALIRFPSLFDSEIKIHPHYGSSASGFEMMGQEGEFSVKNLAGINVTWSFDWINFRLGHTEGDYDVYGDAFDQIDQQLATVMLTHPFGNRQTSDQFRTSDRHGQFTGFGVDMELGDFMFLGEYNRRKTNGLMSDNTSWYGTVAYRIGNFLPHFTLSRYETDEDYSTAQNIVDTFPSGTPEEIAAKENAQGIINFNTVNQDSVTVGLRYDFMPRTALKLEWQRISPDAESSLLSPPFLGPEATYQGEDLQDVDLYTIAIDYLF
jgi:hypothetical protein